MRVIEFKETQSHISMSWTKPTPRYFDELLKCKCAMDLVDPRRKLFPNAKEITESFAAFNAVRRIVGGHQFGNDKIQMVDVACGVRPRTAAVFAMRTKWLCHAVDPKLKIMAYGIDRLILYNDAIERHFFESDDPIIVTMVHAHVDVDVVLSSIRSPRIIVVAIPCCYDILSRDLKPRLQYHDMGIWSGCRDVSVYDIRTELENKP